MNTLYKYGKPWEFRIQTLSSSSPPTEVAQHKFFLKGIYFVFSNAALYAYVALNEVLFLNASSAIYILFSARLKGGRLQFAIYASVWIFLLKSLLS
jgi:hypothetical protein